MSNYGEYIKARAKKDRDFFFGENNVKKISNKYYTFNGVLDEENIIINTSDVKVIKDSFVLVVGSNKCVFLKDWQVKPVHIYLGGTVCENTFLIKLNRNFFKVYTFKNDFYDYEGMKDENFEDLKQIAKEQTENVLYVSNGHKDY